MPTIEITLSARQAVRFDGNKIIITEKMATAPKEAAAPTWDFCLDHLVAAKPTKKATSTSR